MIVVAPVAIFELDADERFLIRGYLSLDLHPRRLKMWEQIIDLPPPVLIT